MTDNYTLTTDHALSSYGLPVLVGDGQAYGSWDMLPEGIPAAAWVNRWALDPRRTPEEHRLAAAFLRQAAVRPDPDPAPTRRYYLHGGYVYEISDGEHTETLAVADGPVRDPDDRYVFDHEPPADIEAMGLEISEEQMHELTGYRGPLA